MAKTIVYRQGDVGLIPRPDLTKVFFEKGEGDKKPKLLKTRVLRRGENGGVHALEKEKSDSVIYEVDGVMYVLSENGVGVVHGEHNRVDLPAGIYEVRVQREADPRGSGTRYVAD